MGKSWFNAKFIKLIKPICLLGAIGNLIVISLSFLDFVFKIRRNFKSIQSRYCLNHLFIKFQNKKTMLFYNVKYILIYRIKHYQTCLQNLDLDIFLNR